MSGELRILRIVNGNERSEEKKIKEHQPKRKKIGNEDQTKLSKLGVLVN
jgi:hypothetical protein